MRSRAARHAWAAGLLAGLLCVSEAHGALIGFDGPVQEGSAWAIYLWLEVEPGEAVSGVQADLLLPAEYALSGYQTGDAAAASGKQAAVAQVADGRIRVLVAGLNQTSIPTGTIAQVLLSGPGSAPGTAISAAVLSSPTGNRVPVRERNNTNPGNNGNPPKPSTKPSVVTRTPVNTDTTQPEGESETDKSNTGSTPESESQTEGEGTHSASYPGYGYGGYPSGLEEALSGEGIASGTSTDTAQTDTPGSSSGGVASSAPTIPTAPHAAGGGAVAQNGPNFLPPGPANQPAAQRPALRVQPNATHPNAMPPASPSYRDATERPVTTSPTETQAAAPERMAMNSVAAVGTPVDDARGIPERIETEVARPAHWLRSAATLATIGAAGAMLLFLFSRRTRRAKRH
ncbi:MAG: hypothetical protein GC168_14365 [Candidatus Hydrogenedens sp.]|nr:hypothetical protein [Candidatus Hydrogenedens sp.]